MPKLPQPSHHLTKPVVQNYELCAHETHWTEALLEKLHQDLKGKKLYSHFLANFLYFIGNARLSAIMYECATL